MSLTTAHNGNGIILPTQMLPEQRATIGTVNNNVNRLEKFLKTQPTALGAVQVMTGVVTMLLGIVKVFSSYNTFSVSTGIVYWGSIIFIIAGCLTAAAENRLHHCMVKASLGINVVSAITSGFAIFLSATDIACMIYMPYELGISGILLVLSILQFITSICVSVFACKATCFCVPEVVVQSTDQQLFSLPIPLTNPSSIEDYSNMDTAVNGHTERDGLPTSRYKTEHENENVYEQPIYDRMHDM